MDTRIQQPDSKPVPFPLTSFLKGAEPSTSKAAAAKKAAVKTAADPAKPAPQGGTPPAFIDKQPLQKLIDSLRSSATALNKGAAAASAQAHQDRLAGKSALSGMSEFSDIVLEAYQIIASQAQQNKIDLGAVTKDPLGQLGKLTQAYLIDQAADSFVQDAVGLLGFEESPESDPKSGTSTAPTVSGGQPAGAASSVSTGAAAGASGSASAAELGLDTVGGKIVGGIGAAYSLYNVFSNWGQTTPGAGAVQGFAAGAYIGSLVPVPGATVIGGAIGGLVGLISGLFKTGKHKDQIARDRVRSMMKQSGFVNEEWQISLAGGARYDIGKDGGFKLTNTDGSKRRAYEVDFKNPLAAETIGWVQPLAALMTGGDQKLGSDFTGYFTNAVLSNASTREEARANAQAFFQSLNVKPEQVLTGIAELMKAGRIDQGRAEAYVNGFAALLEN